MNKEHCNKKVSNDIKPSAYKEIESVTYEKNVGNNINDEFGSDFTFKSKSYIKSRKDKGNNQDNTVFQIEKEEQKNADKAVYNVRGSKLANKEPTNEKYSRNNKSNEYNTYSILFDKKKSSKKRSLKNENNDNTEAIESTIQMKSDINENKKNYFSHAIISSITITIKKNQEA